MDSIGPWVWLVLAAMAAGVAGLLGWRLMTTQTLSREEAERRLPRLERERRIKILRESEALLTLEVAPLIDGVRSLTSLGAPQADGPNHELVKLISDNRAKGLSVHARLLDEATHRTADLAAAGLSLSETLDAVGRTNHAVQDFYAAATRKARARGNEAFEAQTRAVEEALAELEKSAKAAQDQIHVRHDALSKPTGRATA
jgi:hypothetical protein